MDQKILPIKSILDNQIVNNTDDLSLLNNDHTDHDAIDKAIRKMIDLIMPNHPLINPFLVRHSDRTKKAFDIQSNRLIDSTVNKSRLLVVYNPDVILDTTSDKTKILGDLVHVAGHIFCFDTYGQKIEHHKHAFKTFISRVGFELVLIDDNGKELAKSHHLKASKNNEALWKNLAEEIGLKTLSLLIKPVKPVVKKAEKVEPLFITAKYRPSSCDCLMPQKLVIKFPVNKPSPQTLLCPICGQPSLELIPVNEQEQKEKSISDRNFALPPAF
jgi:hypothetical protein